LRPRADDVPCARVPARALRERDAPVLCACRLPLLPDEDRDDEDREDKDREDEDRPRPLPLLAPSAVPRLTSLLKLLCCPRAVWS
jgi:hypothetical protein